MPRERHQIMREYLGERDRLGLHMMHATAGVQANLDFADEADAARKLRLALAASPVTTALFANSPLSEGRPNGFESFRAEVWRHTDTDRWSLLPFAFEDDFGEGTAYRAYTEWALDVPMFLIVRDGHSRPARGITFRHFMAHGFEGHRPKLSDWVVHLTTVFPEVRLKRVVETRGVDAVPGDLVCALPAFWKGLFYDDARARSRARARAPLDASRRSTRCTRRSPGRGSRRAVPTGPCSRPPASSSRCPARASGGSPRRTPWARTSRSTWSRSSASWRAGRARPASCSSSGTARGARRFPG